MEPERIAVIMSLYKNDRLPFVKLAVNSILNQTLSEFDFFIQCDGYVQPEVEDYLEGIKDERIKIFKRDKNKGLAYSLNELLERVMPMGYQFIARMDADDISEINRFERQKEYFRKHPDVECLGSWAVEINHVGDEYYRKKMPENHQDCNKLFKKRDCMIHPTVMFRRSYIEKAGLYSLDTYFGEDTMMWANGFANGCIFANVPEYLFRFRLDENFFERRRGWKHAYNIFLLRHKVNKMLHYGFMADFWAIAYACAKLMPKGILNLIYKSSRKV